MSCSLLTAVQFAADAHRGQLRADGAPFIGHPVAVLHILWRATLDLPLAASLTAMLHDVLEDTSVTREDLAVLAGDDVAIAVDLLTRPPFPVHDPVEAEAAYLRRMFMDAHLFPYVPLIKMADRIHNLLTADALLPEKRRELFAQTRMIYVPFFQLHRPMMEPYRSAHAFLLDWMMRLDDCKNYKICYNNHICHQHPHRSSRKPLKPALLTCTSPSVHP